MIRKIWRLLELPYLKGIVKEWSLYLQNGFQPTAFAELYLELMRDPLDHQGRMESTMFVTFIRDRDWNEVLRILRRRLEPDVLAVFDSEGASDFFESWRAMVIEQISQYWQSFIKALEQPIGVGPKDWSPRGPGGIIREKRR